MTAAERAAALVAGEPAECPRCDGKLDVVELSHAGARSVYCSACNYRSSFAMACVIGKHGDETAAIWLERQYPTPVPDPDPVLDEENVS